MARTSASLTVGFEADAPEIALALELHRGPYSEYGSIPIRLYPAVEATVRATRGTAHLGETRSEDVEEIVDFGGGKTARLKRPNPTGLVFESLQLAFDASGHEVFPTLHYDVERAEVVADIAFHGAFKVKYRTDYRLVYYRYAVDYLPFANGVVLSSGIVYAFYSNASAKIEIGLDNSQDLWQTELYRIYSNIVLDPDGAWEEPPNWNASPRDGSYPNPAIDPRDPDNSFTDERKHRIGYINRLGTVSWTWFFAPTLQPYQASNFQPKYKLKWGTPPDESWKDAFNQVNKAQLRADLAVSFPGLTDG